LELNINDKLQFTRQVQTKEKQVIAEIFLVVAGASMGVKSQERAF
jgi:hypothetical protein